MPEIEHLEMTDAVYNEPALNSRLRTPLETVLGKNNVVEIEPIMGSEDYSYHCRRRPVLLLQSGRRQSAISEVAVLRNLLNTSKAELQKSVAASLTGQR